MRAIASMMAIAALSIEAPALSAGLTASAFNAEVACTTNCDVFCKRCEGAACATEQCAAACEARRRAVCSAFPKSEDFSWTGKWADFDHPKLWADSKPNGGTEDSWASVLPPSFDFHAGPFYFPSPNVGGEWVQEFHPPIVHLPNGRPTPATPPPAPATPPKASSDGGDEHPKTRIIDTRSVPLAHPGEEAAGYGLYTYVLIRQSADRDSHFLKDIVATAPSAAGVAPPLRAQIDLMLIPANPCPAATAKSAANCPALRVETISGDLKANYNYGESNTILEELCANPPEQIAKFCREPFGQGPFLFTYARPVSKMNPIPPPFLFFDFTDQDEAAFPDYIDAYEAVLKSDDFTDDGKLKTLRLRILDVFNRAKAAAGPTAEGAVKLVHLFFPGGQD